jgi:hypothetical protein
MSKSSAGCSNDLVYLTMLVIIQKYCGLIFGLLTNVSKTFHGVSLQEKRFLFLSLLWYIVEAKAVYRWNCRKTHDDQ